jgi:hypothetical protein
LKGTSESSVIITNRLKEDPEKEELIILIILDETNNITYTIPTPIFFHDVFHRINHGFHKNNIFHIIIKM